LYSQGCKSDNSIIPASDNVSIGYYAQNSSNDNTIVIDEENFIIRKIVLELEDDHVGGDGECDIKICPLVVYLDLTQKVVVAAVAQIPIGSFHEIKFQIHKLSPNESVPDPEFVEGSPPHNRFSVIAKGLFNGVPFVYKSWVTFSREIEFENLPIVISERTVINITIRMDLFSWFERNGGIMDPSDPDNRPFIDQNIRNSFRSAFRDLNLDGEPD
jgi:hypothetical protein